MSEIDASPATGGDSVAGDESAASEIRFVTRDVSAEDAAAVTAVVIAMLAEETSTAASDAEPRRDHWVRSGTSIRKPFAIGEGRWVRSGR